MIKNIYKNILEYVSREGIDNKNKNKMPYQRGSVQSKPTAIRSSVSSAIDAKRKRTATKNPASTAVKRVKIAAERAERAKIAAERAAESAAKLATQREQRTMRSAKRKLEANTI